MKCHHCDQEVTFDREHHKEVVDDNGFVIYELTGWTCGAIDWRQRALDAEAKLAAFKVCVSCGREGTIEIACCKCGAEQ